MKSQFPLEVCLTVIAEPNLRQALAGLADARLGVRRAQL